MTPQDIIDAVLIEEGSAFTDRADDRGGPTKYGITLTTLASYLAPAPATRALLEALPQDSARMIYTREYFQRPGFIGIADAGLAAVCVDAAVQHGVPTAVEMLQRAAGVAVDGRLGPVSITAINALEARSLRLLVCGARIRLYGSLVTRDPVLARARAAGFPLQADNALGWANRIARFVEEIT